MNELLEQHLEIRNPSTGDAMDMLHLKDGSTRYDMHYAANTYLVALYEIARLREALQKIADWKLPDATDANGQLSSYELEYGSKGAQMHIRKVARAALESA